MGALRNDPYQGFRFRVEVDGLIVGGFSEVSGLQRETQVEEIREGGVNDYIHRLPKETKYPNLILKRGITLSDVLWRWHEDVVSGKFKRRTVHVILFDAEGADLTRWSFMNAYPVKWAGPEFRADSQAVIFESLELSHTGFTRQ